MNVAIGTEAAQFPGKKFLNGIFVAVFGSWKKITAAYVQYMENSCSVLF
jgi:hypothetical protein